MKKLYKIICLVFCLIIAGSMLVACGGNKDLSYSGATLAAGTVGTSYSQNVATATGDGAKGITYAITNGTLPAGLSLNNGTISGTPTAATSGAVSITVTASATDFNSKEATFSITVSEGVLVYTGATLAAGEIGKPYSQSVATATGVGATGITYAITSGTLPAGLSLNNGTISGTPTAATSGAVSITVTASAAGFTDKDATFLITVSERALEYSGATLAAGTVGTAYSQNVATATGDGATGITYAITSGTLPAGLSFNNGIISGTPTAATSGAVSVTVTASAAGFADKAVVFSITIEEGALSYTSTTLDVGTVGTAYSQNVATATGVGAKDITYTITNGTLPGGLTLNSGIISGTPAAVTNGEAIFTVTASATGFVSTSAVFSIIINEAPLGNELAYNGRTLAAGTFGTAYSQNVATATGIGATGITYAITSGTLPAGLTLNSGIISGTPVAVTSGAVSITVTASATNFTSKAAIFSITINEGILAYTGATLAGGRLDTAYSQNVATATGIGATGITYTRTAGSLPGGLNLSAAGIISGTPTADGTFTFTVTASALNYISALAQFTITIAPASLPGVEYTFEAEYVRLVWTQDGETYERNGAGFSGPASGYDLCYKDILREGKTANASNGYFVTAMCVNGSFIDFEITSDRAVENATLVASLSSEYINVVRLASNNTIINGEQFYSFKFEVINLGAKAYDPLDEELDFYVNPNYSSVATNLDYSPITLYSTPDMMPGDPLADFKDYTISTNVNLVAGTNIIRLRTNNNYAHGGTVSAMSPMVDCIKITSAATLSMNEFRINLNYAKETQ